MDKLNDALLAKIFKYLPIKSWKSVLLTNNQWKQIGRKVFDPSIKNNRAVIFACQVKFFPFFFEVLAKLLAIFNRVN